MIDDLIKHVQRSVIEYSFSDYSASISHFHRLSLSIAMFAARAAFRSPALRRGIHTGRTSNPARSSFAVSGAVLVAGGAAYAAYYSWDMRSSSRRITLEEAGKAKPTCISECLFDRWIQNRNLEKYHHLRVYQKTPENLQTTRL